MEVKFSVDQSLLIGYIEVKGVKVEPSPAELLQQISQAEEDLRSKYTLNDLQSGTFRAYRDLWWAFDMDPTKLRPSAEALIRRILSGKPLFHINNVVDAMNLLSIRHELSIGLHDLDRVKPPLEVRLAKAEPFPAIGSKGQMELKGGELCVADQEKILDLAYSTSSCELSKVTSRTKNMLLTVYTPGSFEDSQILRCLKDASLITRFAGGTLGEAHVLRNR